MSFVIQNIFYYLRFDFGANVLFHVKKLKDINVW